MTARQKLRTIIPIAIVVFAIGILMPSARVFKFEYKKGFPWSYETLTSAFDFPILKTEAEMEAERKAVSDELIPFYNVDAKVKELSGSNIQSLDLGSHNPYKTAILTEIARIYDVGVLPAEQDEFYGKSEYVYILRSKRAEKRPKSEIYTVESAVDALITRLYPIFGTETDSFVLNYGISSLIQPNLVFDEVTSKTFHANSLTDISPTKGIIQAGEIIISEGEIVTDDLAQIIDSYKAEYTQSVGYGMHPSLIYVGHFFFAIIVCLIFLMLLEAIEPSIFQHFNQFLYILLIFTLIILSIFLCRQYAIRPLMFPFVTFAVFLCSFFQKKVILPVYLVALTPILFFFTDGVQDYTIFALAGCSAVYLFQSLKKGYRQFLLAMAVFLVMSVSYVSLSLVSDLTIKGRDFLEMAISSVVMVFVYPLVYLFERIFSLVSSTRLDDLCDTNQPVLKELQTLASGTFQHSMQVMNLSADIAQTIGADVSLVRAGALYHDIGKMVNPQCFIENAPSSGSTYHDQMTCKQSSAAIVRHVTDGLALAKKYRLPSIVADFISTHHGTSTTGYFFTKYVNEGGDPADISSFSYPGPRPKTKEQVIVHICDSIEAASRTLKSYSSESISEFVDGIVHHKLQEGQFDEAQISIEELMMIKARLKKYLEDFYHGRIVYPKSRIQIKQTKK